MPIVRSDVYSGLDGGIMDESRRNHLESIHAVRHSR